MAIKPRGAEVEQSDFTPVGPFYPVTHWQASRKKNVIHLLVDVAEHPASFIIRFKSPDTLGWLLERPWPATAAWSGPKGRRSCL